MENPTISKRTASFGVSLAICGVVNAVLVILKEKNHAVMAWMQKATGHHWITHSLVLLVLFFFLGGAFASASNGEERKLSTSRLLGIVMAGVIVGCLAIAGFYAFND